MKFTSEDKEQLKEILLKIHFLRNEFLSMHKRNGYWPGDFNQGERNVLCKIYNDVENASCEIEEIVYNEKFYDE